MKSTMTLDEAIAKYLVTFGEAKGKVKSVKRKSLGRIRNSLLKIKESGSMNIVYQNAVYAGDTNFAGRLENKLLTLLRRTEDWIPVFNTAVNLDEKYGRHMVEKMTGDFSGYANRINVFDLQEIYVKQNIGNFKKLNAKVEDSIFKKLKSQKITLTSLETIYSNISRLGERSAKLRDIIIENLSILVRDFDQYHSDSYISSAYRYFGQNDRFTLALNKYILSSFERMDSHLANNNLNELWRIYEAHYSGGGEIGVQNENLNPVRERMTQTLRSKFTNVGVLSNAYTSAGEYHDVELQRQIRSIAEEVLSYVRKPSDRFYFTSGPGGDLGKFYKNAKINFREILPLNQ